MVKEGDSLFLRILSFRLISAGKIDNPPHELAYTNTQIQHNYKTNKNKSGTRCDKFEC